MPIPSPAVVAWTWVAGGPRRQTFLGFAVPTESVVAGHLFFGHLHNEWAIAVVVSGAQATTSDATHMASFPDATFTAEGASAAAPNASHLGRFVNGGRGWFSRLVSQFRFRFGRPHTLLKNGGRSSNVTCKGTDAPAATTVKSTAAAFPRSLTLRSPSMSELSLCQKLRSNIL